MPEYEDFEIVFEKVGDADIYAVNVRQPCGGKVGDAGSSFSLAEIKTLPNAGSPVSGDDLIISARNFKPVAAAQESSYTLNYSEAIDGVLARQVGFKLSQILFKNEILYIFGKCQEFCEQKNATLRLRLDLSRTPQLAALPWEYLRTPGDDNFICLDADTTLVRYLRTTDSIRPLKVIPPLRILVIAATPKNLPGLAVNDEIQNIKNALSNISQENVEIVVLPQSTMTSLKTALEKAQSEQTPFHVLHFIGHGAFDQAKKEGVLLFEDEQGKGLAVEAEDFGRFLQPFRSDLRLVVLNACEGARLSLSDSYTSLAAKIIETAEVPAVIAMQFSITDPAAIVFSTSFYGQLAIGTNLEQAVDFARKEINNPAAYKPERPMSANKEWATPVFYLRANNGHLFDIKIPTSPKNLDGHYSAVRQLLPSCNLVVFLGLDVNLLNRPFYDTWKKGNGLPGIVELCSYFSGTLNITPPGNSLAGLAKKLELKGKLLSDEFSEVLSETAAPSKLYQLLGRLTKNITEKLPEEAADPCHCALLFVTTTLDFAFENAFKEAGIKQYHTVYYTLDENGNQIFSHRFFDDGQITVTPLVAPNNANEYKGLRNKYPVILKLQGEVKPDSVFAIKEDDFFAFAHRGLSEFLPADLLGQINTSRHLYLGYDLQDWTLRLLWNRLCENQSLIRKQGSYAVVFDENDDPNAPFWRENKVKFATAGLDDYVAGLEEYVLNKL